MKKYGNLWLGAAGAPVLILDEPCKTVPRPILRVDAVLALGFGPRGEVLVTSDVVPAVWRVDARTLAVSVHPLALDADADKDVGFTSIAYSRVAGAYFARGSIDGACWRIDASLGSARKLRRGEIVPLAAAGMCMQQ